MIIIRTNIVVVTAKLIGQLSSLKDVKPFLRPVAVDVLNMLTERIHEQGKASDGSQIGLYSKGYMAVRTGIYGNSSKVSRGANKGKAKDAGFYTKGRNVTWSVATKNLNAARPRYNRTADKKIIVSLTRQLENDWNVTATDKGWGIGFANPLNAQKLRWVEARKKKIIGNLTIEEKTHAVNMLRQFVNDTLK